VAQALPSKVTGVSKVALERKNHLLVLPGCECRKLMIRP